MVSTHVIKRGEVLDDRNVERDKRFGGYNHSCVPNVILARYHYDILVVALRGIDRREELVVDYGHVSDRGHYTSDSGEIRWKCNCEIHSNKKRRT